MIKGHGSVQDKNLLEADRLLGYAWKSYYMETNSELLFHCNMSNSNEITTEN